MLRPVSAVNRRLIVAAMAAMFLSLAPAPSHAGCSKSVTLYNASWCPYCKQVRAILARNHITYTTLDATTAEVQAIMRKRFGDTAVPRTMIGGVVVDGVDEARIKELCRQQSQDVPRPIDITLPDFPPSEHDAGKWLVAPAIRVRISALP
jgi:glutaredoxin